jgi:hypothetical protein
MKPQEIEARKVSINKSSLRWATTNRQKIRNIKKTNTGGLFSIYMEYFYIYHVSKTAKPSQLQGHRRLIRLTTFSGDVNTDASVDRRPLLQKTLSKSPTSSPIVLQPDLTMTSVLPFLNAILPTSGSHSSGSFLLQAFAYFLGLQHAIATRNGMDDSIKSGCRKSKI